MVSMENEIVTHIIAMPFDIEGGVRYRFVRHCNGIVSSGEVDY